MNRLPNILSILIPIAGSILRFFGDLNNRVISVRSAERDVGKFSNVFRCVLTRPYRSFILTLYIIWFVVLVGIIGGSLDLFLQLSPDGRFFVDWPILVFYNAHLILIAFLALVFLFYTNVITKFILWSKRGKASNWRHDPGWINASWHLKYGTNFEPLNTNIDACNRVANEIVNAIFMDRIEYGQDRADYPREISNSELANYWLIGHTIEDEIHRLGKASDVNFAETWATIAVISKHISQPFKPESLCNLVNQDRDLYTIFRDLAGVKDQALPEQPKISNRLDKVVNGLIDGFEGDAHKLPYKKVKSMPTVRVLLSHLEEFGLSNSIAAQFIKLSKWSRLWPEVEVGPFPYPFSTRVAKLFLNLNYLKGILGLM